MLDYRETFRTIFHLAKNNPTLIILAFISVSAGDLITISIELLVSATDFTSWSPEQLFTAIANLGGDIGRLLAYAAVITAIFAVVWVITAVSSAGLIVGTQKRLEDQPFTVQDGVHHGRRLLWPFIAVDTIIFFPIFVVILLILLIVAGGLATAVTNAQSTSENDLITTVLISFLCAIPSSCSLYRSGLLRPFTA